MQANFLKEGEKGILITIGLVFAVIFVRLIHLAIKNRHSGIEPMNKIESKVS